MSPPIGASILVYPKWCSTSAKLKRRLHNNYRRFPSWLRRIGCQVYRRMSAFSAGIRSNLVACVCVCLHFPYIRLLCIWKTCAKTYIGSICFMAWRSRETWTDCPLDPCPCYFLENNDNIVDCCLCIYVTLAFKKVWSLFLSGVQSPGVLPCQMENPISVGISSGKIYGICVTWRGSLVLLRCGSEKKNTALL